MRSFQVKTHRKRQLQTDRQTDSHKRTTK